MGLKITTEHLDALRSAIAPHDTEERRDAYRRRDFPRAELVKDLDKRYRWDLFLATAAWRAFGETEYLDSHIDTALRRIVKPLVSRVNARALVVESQK